jgi:hypothetical protein
MIDQRLRHGGEHGLGHGDRPGDEEELLGHDASGG